MFEFINYGECILTFVFFLIALYANRSDKKIDFLIIVTALIFLYTLLGMPIVQKNKADANISSYKQGNTLVCTSGYLVFSSTFTVDANKWDLEENHFINKQTKESLRADKCADK